MQESVRRYRSRARYVGNRSADLSWQQRIHSIGDPRGGYVAEGDVRRSRMTFGVALPQIGADMQPIYDGTFSHSTRRDAMLARRREPEARVMPLMARDGVRGSMAAVLLGALFLVLAVLVISNLASLYTEERRVQEVNSRIVHMTSQCENLQRQYEARAAEIDVVYMAVGRGMVASAGLDAISIEVPETAVVRPSDTVGR